MRFTSTLVTVSLLLSQIAFAGDSADNQVGCEQVYMQNFAQLNKELKQNSTGLMWTTAGLLNTSWLQLPDAISTTMKIKSAALAKNDGEMFRLLTKSLTGDAGSEAPLIEGGSGGSSLASLASMAGPIAAATAITGGVLFGGSYLYDKDIINGMIQGKSIIEEAKAGGGKELFALQDQLAKNNPMYSVNELPRERFRQMVLSLNEAKEFCTPVVGDTLKEINQYLVGMPDSEVRYWEGVAPKGKYVAPVPVPTSPSGRVPAQSGVAGE